MSQGLQSNSVNPQNPFGNLQSNTHPFKQRFNNNSGQSRRSNNVQPMEVDNLCNNNEVEDPSFFTN